MKKFIFCATLVALFTSCMKNDVEVGYEVQRTEDFIATFADDTRADLDGTAVVWNADDHLTIFTKTSHNRQYKVKDLSANGRSATFEYVGYTGSDKTAISNNYAVYPYDAEATILGDVITTTLASEQIYNAECDLTYALMSAKSSTNNFSFVNSGALLRFNISTILPDTFDLNYIKVSSQSHNIAGEVTIDTNNHLAVVANNGTNEITLVEINETIDSDVKSFYIAMPAMSFDKNALSVTFSFADGDKTFALPAFNLEQGKIKSIDYTIKDAEEFTGSTPGEDVPAAAKPANNEIWLTLEPSILVDYTEVVSIWLQNLCKNYEIDIETGECILAFDSDVDYIPELGLIWLDIRDSLSVYSIPCPVISITLPECVTAIGYYAFASCELLLEINIPDSVTTIREGAFYESYSLTSVYITDLSAWCKIDFSNYAANPLKNGANLYLNNELVTDLVIPSDITEIKSYAFSGCRSLTGVTIPDSVTTIGSFAFADCYSLTSVTIPDSVTTIGFCAFEYCTGELLVNCNIPSASYNYNGAFYGSKFTSVTIGDSVTTIGSYAFFNCDSLISVTIGESVTTIGGSAFSDCSSLTSVTIGDSVTTIGGGAFEDCTSLTSVYITDLSAWCRISFEDDLANPLYYAGNLYLNNELVTDLVIPSDVTEIKPYAFYGCSSLTSVTIPDSVTTIGERAFYDCSSLTSVYISDLSAWCKIDFGNYYYYANPLHYATNLYLNNELVTDLVIPSDITEIKPCAFWPCNSLTSVTIPDSVTTIGNYAFDSCSSLTSVTIPDSVTTIGERAFYDCSSLTSVTIPDSVTTIGEGAFALCMSLTSVYCKATTPPAVTLDYDYGWDAFARNSSGRKIYVPMESVEAYQSAEGWSEYKSYIVGYKF